MFSEESSRIIEEDEQFALISFNFILCMRMTKKIYLSMFLYLYLYIMFFNLGLFLEDNFHEVIGPTIRLFQMFKVHPA